MQLQFNETLNKCEDLLDNLLVFLNIGSFDLFATNHEYPYVYGVRELLRYFINPGVLLFDFLHDI